MCCCLSSVFNNSKPLEASGVLRTNHFFCSIAILTIIAPPAFLAGRHRLPDGLDQLRLHNSAGCPATITTDVTRVDWRQHVLHLLCPCVLVVQLPCRVHLAAPLSNIYARKSVGKRLACKRNATHIVSAKNHK